MQEKQKTVRVTNTEQKEIKQMFETVYFELKKPIYWYVRKKVNTDELAEDITADVFVKLFQNPEIMKTRDTNGVRAWLYTVARNLVIDYYRRKSTNTEKTGIDEGIFDIIASEETDYLQDFINEEQTKVALGALELCTSEEKEIISLRFREDMKFNEIADIVGKEDGAVKMIFYRAIEKMKKQLRMNN